MLRKIRQYFCNHKYDSSLNILHLKTQKPVELYNHSCGKCGKIDYELLRVNSILMLNGEFNEENF